MQMQRLDVVGTMRGQSAGHVFQVSIRIKTAKLRRPDQAYDRGCTLHPRAAGLRPTSRPWSNLALRPVIVDGRVPVIQIARERFAIAHRQGVTSEFGKNRTLSNPSPQHSRTTGG
jgi:hypothetical protein